MLLDIIHALFYFYALLFTGTLIALFIGLRMLYVAMQRKDDELMRKAKFVLMFAVIAMICIAIVSFLLRVNCPLTKKGIVMQFVKIGFQKHAVILLYLYSIMQEFRISGTVDP